MSIYTVYKLSTYMFIIEYQKPLRWRVVDELQQYLDHLITRLNEQVENFKKNVIYVVILNIFC